MPKKSINEAVRIVKQKKATADNLPKLDKVRIEKVSQKANRPSLLIFTLNHVYKLLYILGVTLYRRCREWRRWSRLFTSKTIGAIYGGLYRISVKFGHRWQRVRFRIAAPFCRISNVYREQAPIIAKTREEGGKPTSSYLLIAQSVLDLLARFLITCTNHILPFAAFMVMLFLMNGFVNQDYGLRVTYKGEEIGSIQEESIFDAAARDVMSRVIADTEYTFAIDTPAYELVMFEQKGEKSPFILQYFELLRWAGIEVADLSEFTTQNELADRMVKLSGRAVEEAYGLYIDNRFYGAIPEKERFLDLLDRLKQNGLSGKPGERVEFVKKIDFSKGLYLKETVVKEQVILDLVSTKETKDQIYVVQAKDTPYSIAAKTGVSYSFLKQLNPGMEDGLYPGDQLLTSVAKPFLETKNIYLDTYTEEVPFETDVIQNALYAVSYREQQRVGVPGVREVMAEVTTVNGIEAGRVELSAHIIREPIAEQVMVGVSPQALSGELNQRQRQSVTQGGFIWPLAYHPNNYISSGLGGYPGHTGVDIAGPAGTSIYAAAAGTVVKAQRDYYGYGIHCVIDNGDGYTTLYAHMSEMYVVVGDTVAQGQVIGARGRTGNTTGNHLHFEVKVNGATRDPLDYVAP